MSAVVELRGVFKSYFGHNVLNGVDLRLDAGLFYMLVGPNGAGKSTLMKILMRQLSMDRGEGKILGFGLDEDVPHQNERVALVSEATDYALPLRMDEVFARFSRIYPRWDEALFRQLQAQLGVDLGKRFSDLSRGQRMQVAMMVALATRPQLLLLDEITSVLDVRAREIIVERLHQETQLGATVVLSTNIVTEVQHYADKVITLAGGCIR